MTDVSRRAFLATTAASLGAGLAGPGASAAVAADTDFTDLVDAHVHVDV